MVEALSPSLLLDDAAFRALVTDLLGSHRVIGPRQRDFSIVLDTIDDAHDLAAGVTLEQAPGSCRITPLAEGDDRRFAWAVGPDSARPLQQPRERTLFTARVDGSTVDPEPPTATTDGRPLAVVGLRPCDLAGVSVLHNVLGGWAGPDDPAGGESQRPFVVAVNCTDPAGTCFCASMGTGPELAQEHSARADIVMWERAAAPGTGAGPTYLVTHTSERGQALVDAVATTRAASADAEWVKQARAESIGRMGRRLNTQQLPERLAQTLDSARWDDVADRCLSCGNCTLVCPTCFCSSAHDSSSLDGSSVMRSERWDTCFSLDHSHVHGGSVRSETRDRYRQWLTHKLSSWWGQFGESGCVGCGRCIAWCPVGIDIVEEANALSVEAIEGGAAGTSANGESETIGATAVLVRMRKEHER